MPLQLRCNLMPGHAGDHEAWFLNRLLASWPNVPAPPPTTPVPAPPDPPDSMPPPAGAPDPDGSTAPDPRPKPIDYTDWISDEDLL